MKMPNYFLVALLTIASGCANWNAAKDGSTEKLPFEKPRMSPNAVVIEVGVARIDASQASQLELLFKSIDQQELPLETRKQLDRNGLKCGILSTRTPSVFNELLQPYLPNADSVNVAAKPLAIAGKLNPISRLLTHQRVANQDGEVYPIGTSDLYPKFTWSVHEPNRHMSGSVDQARCFFNVTTFPNTDGSVTIKLTPVIRHGAERPRIEVADGSFVLDRGQQRLRLESLEFDLQLRVGETLVVSAAKPFRQQSESEDLLGPKLLGSELTGATHLLLVRLVQTQMNDLFDRSLSDEKLSTTSDF